MPKYMGCKFLARTAFVPDRLWEHTFGMDQTVIHSDNDMQYHDGFDSPMDEQDSFQRK